jgi:hypothetical protein
MFKHDEIIITFDNKIEPQGTKWQAMINNARKQIMEDVDREIFDMLKIQDEIFNVK